MISPDSPITRRKDDELGRAAFAKALAKAVQEFDGEDSFVVGIHGKWGTGKSSVLNLLVEELERVSTDRLQTVDILRFIHGTFRTNISLFCSFFDSSLRIYEHLSTAARRE